MISLKTNKNPRLNAAGVIALMLKAIKTETGIRTIKFVQSEFDLFFNSLVKKVEKSANTVTTKLPSTTSPNSIKN
jgi:hypothetical protein